MNVVTDSTLESRTDDLGAQVDTPEGDSSGSPRTTAGSITDCRIARVPTQLLKVDIVRRERPLDVADPYHRRFFLSEFESAIIVEYELYLCSFLEFESVADPFRNGDLAFTRDRRVFDHGHPLP
ncbi:hypothetical protein A6E15_07070 [Natrinema saccharevitans]|uniref:Uncharacterized protein n=1 Tax=Natrinema saccharevitans TaxID=301967 RepID=A0A1S8AV90_9EURY|nr:hypothetical protein A6E15_07070 [Natrinema saccharevitans]